MGISGGLQGTIKERRHFLTYSFGCILPITGQIGDFHPLERVSSYVAAIIQFLAACNSTNQNLLLRANRFLGSRRFPNIPTTEPKMDSIAMPGRILHHRHQAEPVLH